MGCSLSIMRLNGAWIGSGDGGGLAAWSSKSVCGPYEVVGVGGDCRQNQSGYPLLFPMCVCGFVHEIVIREA